MAKISQYTDSGPIQVADLFVIARGGLNYKVLPSRLRDGVGMTRGHLWGLTLSNNVTDPTNDIDIQTGEARDSTNAADMTLNAILTKQLDAAWAVGTNAGGLDTGAVGNNTYHVWLIKRSDTGVVDALFSTSASSPTMPANYDYKRRIGSIKRISGAIKGFVQDGDLFMWKTPTKDVTAANPGTSAVTRTLNVPVGIRVKAIIAVSGQSAAAGASLSGIYISDLSCDDVAASQVGATFSIASYDAVSNDFVVGGQIECMTDTSAQVRSRCEATHASGTLHMSALGWVDTRNRLS